MQKARAENCSQYLVSGILHVLKLGLHGGHFVTSAEFTSGGITARRRRSRSCRQPGRRRPTRLRHTGSRRLCSPGLTSAPGESCTDHHPTPSSFISISYQTVLLLESLVSKFLIKDLECSLRTPPPPHRPKSPGHFSLQNVIFDGISSKCG
jgi:hypothetical protein